MHSPDNARDRIKSLYDPELFRVTAETVTQQLELYFTEANEVPRVRQWSDPVSLLAIAEKKLADAPQKKPNQTPEQFSPRIQELAKLYLETNHKLHSPHYMGHQVPPSIPIAGVFDMIGSATNQACGLYEMGPLPTVAERAITHEFARMVGWDTETYGSIGTSGGSLANLTALLAARNFRYKDVWKNGFFQMGAAAASAGKPFKPAIITGADSHYSVSRAAGIMGMGADQVLKAPLDSKRRMDPQGLKDLLSTAAKNGMDVFCIVATSCTTPTGSFDDLQALGEIARSNQIWFHVDGAHGASVLFSKKYKSLVKGIELADSITWDAHKLLYVPSLSTFLLYREKEKSYLPFQQDAPYLHDPNTKTALEFDAVARTLECTKRPLAMSLWSLWVLFGPSIFEDMIDITFDLTKEFHSILSESGDFEPLSIPEANILCFRYIPAQMKGKKGEEIALLQKNIRDAMVRTGEFYTTGTVLNGEYCLRVTLIHPLTDKKDLLGLMESFRKEAIRFL